MSPLMTLSEGLDLDRVEQPPVRGLGEGQLPAARKLSDAVD